MDDKGSCVELIMDVEYSNGRMWSKSRIIDYRVGLFTGHWDLENGDL